VSQAAALTEMDFDWLARHLGHDVRVHREFYRLHESTVELAKISKLLFAVDHGSIDQLAGKSLADLNVEGTYILLKPQLPCVNYLQWRNQPLSLI
jgi:hypothetical protein